MTKRDLSIEKEFEKILLQTQFVKKTLMASNYFCPLDKVQKSLQELKSNGFTLQFQDKEVLLYTDKHIEWSITDKLTLKGSLRFEQDQKVSIVDAIQSKEKFINLSSTQVALVFHLENLSKLSAAQ
jgi:hypothetical protein